MSCCQTGDHIAKDHIHTDTTTCKTKEPQQKYRCGTDSKRLLDEGRGRGGAEREGAWKYIVYVFCIVPFVHLPFIC